MCTSPKRHTDAIEDKSLELKVSRQSLTVTMMLHFPSLCTLNHLVSSQSSQHKSKRRARCDQMQSIFQSGQVHSLVMPHGSVVRIVYDLVKAGSGNLH